MSHSIPTRVNSFIPAGMEWYIPFRPEWNAIPWLGLRNMPPGGAFLGFLKFFFENFKNCPFTSKGLGEMFRETLQTSDWSELSASTFLMSYGDGRQT